MGSSREKLKFARLLLVARGIGAGHGDFMMRVCCCKCFYCTLCSIRQALLYQLHVAKAGHKLIMLSQLEVDP